MRSSILLPTSNHTQTSMSVSSVLPTVAMMGAPSMLHQQQLLQQQLLQQHHHSMMQTPMVIQSSSVNNMNPQTAANSMMYPMMNTQTTHPLMSVADANLNAQVRSMMNHQLSSMLNPHAHSLMNTHQVNPLMNVQSHSVMNPQMNSLLNPHQAVHHSVMSAPTHTMMNPAHQTLHHSVVMSPQANSILTPHQMLAAQIMNQQSISAGIPTQYYPQYAPAVSLPSSYATQVYSGPIGYVPGPGSQVPLQYAIPQEIRSSSVDSSGMIPLTSPESRPAQEPSSTSAPSQQMSASSAAPVVSSGMIPLTSSASRPAQEPSSTSAPS